MSEASEVVGGGGEEGEEKGVASMMRAMACAVGGWVGVVLIG